MALESSDVVVNIRKQPSDGFPAKTYGLGEVRIEIAGLGIDLQIDHGSRDPHHLGELRQANDGGQVCGTQR